MCIASRAALRRYENCKLATCVSLVCSGCSYGDILQSSRTLAALIKGAVGTSSRFSIPYDGIGCMLPAHGTMTGMHVVSGSTDGPRVAIMAGPGRQYVEGTWGSWMARCIAVPLCTSHPPA